MSILKNYLNKLGVKNFSELNEEEKETYRNWETTLTGRKLTDEDVGLFLESEEEETVQKLIDAVLSERDDIFLKMKLEMIRKIKTFLNTPEFEKQVLEQNINQLKQ